MPPPSEPTYLRPALGTALVSTFLGLAMTCGFVTLGWLRDRGDSSVGVVNGGVRAWLVSHGSGLAVDGVPVNIVPLGAVLVCVGLVVWAAGRCLHAPLDEVAPYIAVTAGTYGVIAALLSVATNNAAMSTNMVRSTVVAVLVAATGATLGAARNNGGLATLWVAAGPNVRAIVPAASAGLLAMLGAALAVFGVMLALHLDRARELWAALDPGLAGGLALAAGCVLVAPNLVLWTASALLGPGFALGTDTSVDLSGAHLGAVPGLPLFAALPGPGVFPGWIFVLGLLPLLAGGVAGWRLRTADGRPLLERIGLGAVAGAIAGLACGLLIAVSGGALGPGRMSAAGPPRLMPALVAIGVLALGGAIGAAAGHYRVARAPNSPTGSPDLRRGHKSPSAR